MSGGRYVIPPPGGYQREHAATFGAGTLRCPPHEWNRGTTVWDDRSPRGRVTMYWCRNCNANALADELPAEERLALEEAREEERLRMEVILARIRNEATQ